MADIRINSLPTTATSFNTDDYIAIDGASAGTRRMLAANPPFSDVTLGTSGPSVKSTLSARAPRQGLVFDGTAGATVSVPALGTADYTFAIWINPTSLSTQERRLLGSDSAGAFEVQIDRGVAGSISIIKSNVLVVTTTGALLTAGKQQLVTITRTGTSGVISINGVQAATFTDSQNYTIASDKIGVISTLQFYYKGGLIGPLVYNRALSASEVVALYESGAPAGADYGAIGGNATNSSIVTGADSNFSSDTGNWLVALGSKTISGGTLQLTDGSSVYYSPATAVIPVGKKVRFTVTVTSITGGNARYYNGSSYVNFASSAGTYTVEFTALAATRFYLSVAGGNAVFDDYTAFWLGLLLAPDAAQAGGGLVWYDTSGNAANITLPASGVSWNVPSSRVLGGNWTTSGNLTLGTGSGAIAGYLNRGTTAQSNLVQWQTAGSANWSVGSGATGTNTNLEFYNHNTASTNLLLNYSTGNFLIGTTTDSGPKLQIGTNTTTSAGGMIFGTDTYLYRYQGGGVALDHGSGAAPAFQFRENGSNTLRIETNSGVGYITTTGANSLILRTNTTTALTLDSSQNATFAGRVISNGTGYGVGANSDANTPFNALTSINGTFGALIKNTNAGSSAFAGINIEADSGQAGFRQYSTAHSVWGGKTLISAPSGGTGLVLLTNGAGDAIDFWTNATQALSIDASQNIVPGTAALATTATNGFIYLQTCAGAPTGVPTTYTGRVASIYDTTNNKLYVYNGGWKSVTLA